MRSMLVVDNLRDPAFKASGKLPSRGAAGHTPQYLLEEYGYQVTLLDRDEQTAKYIDGADAVILHVPLNEVKTWGTKLLKRKRVPIMWWCSSTTASLSAAFCEDDAPVDGILTPSMSAQELHWALQFGSKQCMERQQWYNERKQLESRLEERKWIDMAKGILCKIKNISEAEAYEFLRKQAMNERKRMVDVATSIVKVYQILQDQK
ncbi:ANTAR domain-containing response regulator [Paenibacillus harenae]|uniref:Response regulator NasT n=1 Tax=Paenibacillus harenae TaxID=306543 RepID=A0ABT9U585_PAEHA|nr:ANTAR domain-containing protein [Paenibacillus harenae]MDQ0113424.1 response regulator NasT [Paenibacillus harenae]